MMFNAIMAGILCALAQADAASQLDVLEPNHNPPPSAMMELYLRAKMVEAFERRADALEQIKTPEDCEAHQRKMREFFVRQLGGWPDKSPLNAKVIDKQDRGPYVLEKIMYESRPQFYVTALMYTPKTEPPYPAVLVPCGHDANGKAGETYQRACIFLAVNGIAALCYDPIGQGERGQLLDSDGKQKYNSTIEHTLVAPGSILLGINTASYRIWDGIRSIDYLCSRADVDADRIGCTGNSGGGTLTSYISALDERVVCAAPSCYITSLRDLILIDGPHDAEQNIAGALAFGMDHGDYLMMRAPKPTLTLCATRDFFPIQGTWDTYRFVKRFYTRMGYPERLDIAENDAEHGYTPPLRQAMVRWMRRWLLGVDDAVTEPDLPVLKDDEAWVTPKGQVLLLDGARSVFDINNELADQLRETRAALRQKETGNDLLHKVRGISGVRPLEELPAPEIHLSGTLDREGYRIDKLVIRPETGIELPAWLYVPEGAAKGADLCVSEHGKAQGTEFCERRAREGNLVLAVDLRNNGETESHWSHGAQWEEFFGPSYKAVMLAYLLDRPFVAMWAEDLLVCGRYLKGLPEAKGLDVTLHSEGSMNVAALHAVALDLENVFNRLTVENGLSSWDSNVVRSNEPKRLITAIHGALRAYDLPDLAEALRAAGKLAE